MLTFLQPPLNSYCMGPAEAGHEAALRKARRILKVTELDANLIFLLVASRVSASHTLLTVVSIRASVTQVSCRTGLQ